MHRHLAGGHAARHLRDTVDLTLATTATRPADASAAVPRATIAADGQQPRPFTVAARISPHVRHQHKYTAKPLPPERRFYFHTLCEAGTAATLEEFSRHLRHCDPYILTYHLSRGDFSRWVTGTLADYTLGRQVAAIERDLAQHHAAALERAWHQITHAIDGRYPGSAGDQDSAREEGPGQWRPCR